jgi:tyrosine-protein kinase
MSRPLGIEQLSENDGLSTALAMLRRRWRVIVLIVVACTALAVVHHQRAAKTYNATASVAFRNSTLPTAALQVQDSGSGDPLRDAATEVLIARSQQVASMVQKQLNTRAGASQLLDLMKVQAAENADVLDISASTGDPAFSARLANAFANQYIQFKADTELKHIDAARQDLRQQIDALPASSPDRSGLEQSLQRLSELRSVAGGGANIIALASPPSTPAGAGIATTGVLGVVVGLALGFAIAFLLEAIDRRIKSLDELERAYRLPIIGRIPQSAFRHGRADERGEELEPYRILRSSLDLAAVTRDISTLLITSATSGEGKTTVAVDLAHAAALDGRQVVLAELDLRRPTFSEHLGTGFREGITLAFAAGTSPTEYLVEPFIDLPNFSVLPAGPLPPNPAELLGSATMREIIAELTPKDGILIIDSAPLNPVADTHALMNSGAISASLIVARLNKIKRDEVRDARAILARQAIEPLGLVVTGVRVPAGHGYERHRAPGTSPNGDVPRQRKLIGRRMSV